MNNAKDTKTRVKRAIISVLCLFAVIAVFVVGLLVAFDAFVPRSQALSFAFHVYEFLLGLFLIVFSQRVLVRLFSSRRKIANGNVCTRQFGCRFVALAVVISLASVVALLCRVVHTHDVKMQIPSPKISASPQEVRVVPVARKSVAVGVQIGAAVTSSSVAIVCGGNADKATRYDARNDAFRSIARRRDLPEEDVVALMEYVAATDCVMRVEREAALKNDVLNLLRNQKQQPEGLADLLLDMVASKQYAPVIIDYCIQHLGAMVGSVSDDPTKWRIRETFVAAARNTNEPYAGTALYSLAELPPKSKDDGDELRQLTIGLCNASANPIARIAAIQLAGERSYRDVLPTLREVLGGPRRNTVLDMAVVGSIGLLGDAKDVQLLESFRSRGGRRLKPAIDAAVQRIKERAGAN